MDRRSLGEGGSRPPWLLRVLLLVVDAARWLAPAARRREWRRQWRADIWHEWRWLERRSTGIAPHATLVARTAGAIRHAFWLRLHVRKIEMLTQDLRYGWRSLVRRPGFTLIAVVTLGVGIGANITIFSLVNAVLLKPLASYESDRVVRLAARSATGRAVTRFSFSFPDLVDIRERSTTLTDLSGVNLGTFIINADNRTDQVIGEIASGRYLSMLGARAIAGRTITEADDRPGAAPVVVIGDAFRRRRFGPGLDVTEVVGRQVLLTGRPYTIVGVVDRSFAGSFVAAPVDLWVPIETSGTAIGPNWRTDRSNRALSIVGRLRPGITAAQAGEEMRAIAGLIARDIAPAQRLTSIDVLPGTLVTGDQRRLARVFLSLLLGLVGLVLLVACANVGNLVLARVLGRRRELAVRVALGASRARLAWMLLTESALVAILGGAFALALSLWTSRLFSSIAPLPTFTLRLDLRPDARIIGFAALATIGAAVVLAVVGVFQAMRTNAAALKEDSTASIGGRSPARLRAALAAVQIAVSLVLLAGAALFLRSARNAEQIDLGFETRGVLATDLDAAGRSTPAGNRRLFDEIVQRVSSLPSVEAAAVSTRAPLDSSTPVVRVSGREAITPATESTTTTASILIVGPRYFDVVKTPLAAGRVFGERDDTDRPPVAIVNETLAARLWPDGDAIGGRLWLDPSMVSDVSDTSATVVGVARNSKYLTLGEENHAHIYLPFAQHPRPGMALLIRSSDLTDRLTNTVQETLRSVDPDVHGFFTRTLTEHVGVSTLPVRLAARTAALVSALALGLAIVGLYSLVSYLVAERTREIGLRMALGAGASDVMRLVLGHGVKLACTGLALGVPIALASSRLAGSLLYGVTASDPLVFAAVPAMILLVAVAACYIPARRATRLDPLAALRHD